MSGAAAGTGMMRAGAGRAGPRPARRWEVDCLRGVAVVLMVAFHLVWNLDYFGIGGADVTAGAWPAVGRTSALLFLLLAGVSLHLGAARAGSVAAAGSTRAGRQVKRGATVFAWGLAISGVTWLVLGDSFVRFGILHLIGASIVLAQPLLRLGRWNLLLGGGVVALGVTAQGVVVDVPWLLPLGIRPAGFVSVDYYPLLPWFGVVLIGLVLGDLIYGRDARRGVSLGCPAWPPVRLLRALGRHSLAVYVLHQPVLIGTLAGLVGLDLLRVV